MRWRNRATSLLHHEIRSTMPPGEEDTLSPGATSDLIAFLLESSGRPAGDDALPPEKGDLNARRLCTDAP